MLGRSDNYTGHHFLPFNDNTDNSNGILMNKINWEQMAKDLYVKIKEKQLQQFRERMPENKQGVPFSYNGKQYIAAIRRLTPAECMKLQTVPDDYEFVSSESQAYKCLGNGWTVDVVAHILSFLPEEMKNKGMKVLSLFDGMSCGQLALKSIGAKVTTYLASEIDKYAIANTMNNFPDTIQLGSVTDVNVDEVIEKYGVPDIIVGGSPCFAAGTKVLTSEGYKNIEDVEIGDMVLTHQNRYRPVLATGHKSAVTYNLTAQGFVKVCCTANHPFYARKKSFVPYIQDNGRASKRLILGDTEWMQAEKLAKGYYVANNIEQYPDENPLGITEEEAWVIGRYIADGHTRKDKRYDTKPNGVKGHNGSRAWQLILSIGNKKAAKFASHIENLHFSRYPHSQGVQRFVFSNKRLVEIVEDQCGNGSLNKHFGEKLIRLPKHLLRIVLDAYLEGDGSYDAVKRVWKITSVSKMMPITIQRVVSKLYGRHICVTRHDPSPLRMLCGRMVHQNPQYVIRFSPESMSGEKAKCIGDKIWQGVKSFKQIGRQTVYNLEVEGDNSYTANNIIVHNCQAFSFSGKMKGMSTKQGEEVYTIERYLELKREGFQFEGQSYLFWEYMRILNEVRKYNPNVFFLLENVKMLEKWERCLSHAIGVRGVHINSALVSAQQRKRIYWSNIRTKPVSGDSLFYDEADVFAWPQMQTDIPQPEDKGLVIKDILQDGAGEKYYLKDEVVEKLIEKTDKSKLTPYLLEPQVSVDEALEYMASSDEYTSFTDEEKREIAILGYKLEKERLQSNKAESM